MTMNRVHHTNASIARFYLPVKVGGRGLMDLQYLNDKKNTKPEFESEFMERKAIYTLVLFIKVYSFRVIEFSNSDLQKINRKTRTDMTRNRISHTNACIIRHYLPQKIGSSAVPPNVNSYEMYPLKNKEIIEIVNKLEEYSYLLNKIEE